MRINKTISSLVFIILLTSCSDTDIEELVFRKTLEYSLIDSCEDDEECKEAVKSQIQECMVSSNWLKFLKNQDDENELDTFTEKFYACIVDGDGNPYFYTP
ncbi:hypothetical protein WNY51_03760 [Pseudocolwellia sp. AS88]|uniref:hypothetical protein n=1 Tax=Pseudocolwellia TaxID=2848177 RepID=UPI0026ED3183|nr:hypothetical protein [Pseudocolwellia sp. AS88]MDO7085683.1 hypothetical protein [Pseudocolwellia sp. AS88]